MNKLLHTIEEYFETLDTSLEKLSHKNEGKITGLPKWALENREIKIGITSDHLGIVLKVSPQDDLENDTVVIGEILSDEDKNKLTEPLQLGIGINQLSTFPFMMLSDFSVVEANQHPLKLPEVDDRNLYGFGHIEVFLNTFTPESAKTSAIQLWNLALTNVGKTTSFVREADIVFSKFRSIVRRKNFLERRIHRFINEHQSLLLPRFSRCLFEHKLYSGEEMKKADFILEREFGHPALLIELESPIHKVITKNGDFTKEVNHAKKQIADWVSIIDNDPDRNASGDLSFLRGPKQRLIVIGRGLEHRVSLLNTKYTDTVIWTYEILLEQAIKRWNDEIAAQCKLIGLPVFTPFK